MPQTTKCTDQPQLLISIAHIQTRYTIYTKKPHLLAFVPLLPADDQRPLQAWSLAREDPSKAGERQATRQGPRVKRASLAGARVFEAFRALVNTMRAAVTSVPASSKVYLLPLW